MKSRVLISLAVLIVSVAVCSPAVRAADKPLNIVVFLVDDMGWTGPSSFGSDLHQTPNIDRFTSQSLKFTNAYAACAVCSPTRAALMTGMYPARLHLTDWIAGQNRANAKLKIPDWTRKLEHRHTTIAEALKAAGYATAHIGKWHLASKGADKKEYFPQKHGFDINIAGTDSGSPPGGYFLPNRLDLPGARKGEYLTDRLTDDALKIIDDFKDRPFFLHFSYYTVHTPIQGKKELTAHYQSKIKPGLRHTNATYAAMHHSLDESVGRVLARLDELGLSKRTAVFFTSDNGGLSYRTGGGNAPVRKGPTDNTPLRRGKGSAFEGGLRVPLAIRWPGVTKAGAVCHEPVCTVDFYPTILEMAKVKGDAGHNKNIDGLSLVSLLGDPESQLDRDALYWHYPHFHAGSDSPYGVIRARDWKLIERYEDGSLELYHLSQDLSETKDLAATNPQQAKKLAGRLAEWRKRVDAQMPTPNPDYDPEKAKQPARRKMKKQGKGRAK